MLPLIKIHPMSNYEETDILHELSSANLITLCKMSIVFSPTNAFTRESMSMSQEYLLVFSTHYARARAK